MTIQTLKPPTKGAGSAYLPDRFSSETSLKRCITNMQGRLATISAALNAMEQAVRLGLSINKTKAQALLREQHARETALFWLERSLEQYQQPRHTQETVTTQVALQTLLEATAVTQAKLDALSAVAIATRSTTAVTLGLLKPQPTPAMPQFSPPPQRRPVAARTYAAFPS
ncbi:MAG: hypothetical protein F6K42_02440 [Leptolyngbya sp. SIO1D8]|nr:hypothetical protein [Leptolyngbya sp. SIO1D8]